MRNVTRVVGLVSVLAVIGLCQAKASFHGMPRTLKFNLDRLNLDGPALAPIAHTRFCLNYPDECRVRRKAFRRPGIKLTERRWNDLSTVNAEVNTAIKPQRHSDGVLGTAWSLHPEKGDCKDFAATKRHELLKRGWPSRALLLAEVITNWGEHHLVLVVRTTDGDFVLDNLHRDVRVWRKAAYRWVKIQSPHDPKFWSAIRAQDAKPLLAAL